MSSHFSAKSCCCAFFIFNFNISPSLFFVAPSKALFHAPFCKLTIFDLRIVAARSPYGPFLLLAPRPLT